MNRTDRLRVAVLISGSGTNLQAIMDCIAGDMLQAKIVSVISDRPKAFGLQRAASAGIEQQCVDYSRYSKRSDFDAAIAASLQANNPELIVLAGYMRILPAAIVLNYAGRMLNVHPSLLPAYPGLHTYARALAAGEQWHGSTVHFVTPELDAGPGIIQYRVRIRPGETERELRQRVQQGEYIIYPRAIQWFAQGRIQYSGDRVLLDGEALQQPVLVEETLCTNN